MKYLDSIKIVLLETSHPGNIGSTARAMKTMGLSHLVLVRPKVFPSDEATAMASGASDILEHCQVVDTLEEALNDCEKVYGCTARARDLNWPMLTPREAANEISKFSSKAKIAIVFGRERTGLSNEELWLCGSGICIPTSSQYRSLNLAQAVQIIAYELYHQLQEAPTLEVVEEEPLANHQALEQFLNALESLMIRVAFMRADEPKRLMPKLRRLFNRARPRVSEINILRGILTQITKHLR